MKIDNNISVIIPVYNAAPFVAKAVESALNQLETKEIILVEDGSKDNSLEICKSLAAEYESVKLFTHPGNCNKGAGASRNLGIEKANGDYVAFLDADDFYLPERFRAERLIFSEKPATDGVYGALGFHYYSEIGKAKYRKEGFKELTTLPGKVPANELFYSLLWLHEKVNGHFSLDTLTLKRNVFFGKTEMFNNLELHEDTVFIIQLSLNCNLAAGIINEPIGMRGVHNNNRIVNRHRERASVVLMWAYLFHWAKKSSKSRGVVTLFGDFMMKEKVLYSKRVKAFFLLAWFSLNHKNFVRQRMFFNPSCTYVFGNYYGNKIIVMKEKILEKIWGSNHIIKAPIIEVNHLKNVINR